MLTLEVRVSNSYAIKMYEEIGFKVGTIRNKYYENKVFGRKGSSIYI